ncbi:Inactive glucose-6-phosphate 1-dehydrogenase 4 [Citrus sinensis]|uniref:Inactive glucose-6-phosphate 1-dehydrogenase 4 n=1 Tax=Citrus sinensis TaxID=2711 RepID=A0ACB8JNB8_CITSI|nr:Inactive glucose-6-phosphate 1-dehydrogenase 4 [Citrus sinensis]
MSVSFSNFPAPFPATGKNIHTVTSDRFVLYGGSATICQRFCGLRLWLLDRLHLKHCSKKHGLSESKVIKNQDKLDSHLETSSSNDGRDSEGVSTLSVPNVTKRPTSKLQAHSPNFLVQSDQAPSLCIAVIGATGELARRKIFPALFALYYSGFLPENVGIVGYSRKNLTDEDLRSIIASTLTCRIDHRENCGDKIDAFLSRTYYLNGGYDNREGMLKLSALMEHIEVILSEEMGVQSGRYFDGYGIIRDIVHSHILQTIALLAMEPPISLNGEDIRNEKVKVLRSIRRLEPSNVILGQYKATFDDKVDVKLNSLTPTYFAAILYIDNARWDGVPFLIKAGTGLIKHRVNNKVPGLGLQLDASELNLLYKDKYNAEVPDSYEHLLLDVIDGDNHLFMRSDELTAAWNILNPVLQEIDKNNIAPELYELGGRGPVGAYYLWAKHGVQWTED